MLIRAAHRHRNKDASGVSGRLSVQTFLLIGFIAFLILWSFTGTRIEKGFYGMPAQAGHLGAEIMLSSAGNVSSDLVIGHVYRNSPAERGGLRTGDRIVGLNGRIITTPDRVKRILDSENAGASLKITVLRRDRTKDIHIYLGDRILRDKAQKAKALPPAAHRLIMVIILAKIALMFLLLYFRVESRMVTVLFFAGGVLFLGMLFGIYDPIDAFFSIRFDTLSLLLGMGIVSVVLDQSGFFDTVAYRLHELAGGSKLRILVLFCFITYLLSLVTNNLTTILIVVPMTLNLSAIAGFNPRQIIIGEIIASNIGGASTMVGDFPNMLIASEAGIGFNQFIVYMLPICIILFAMLLLYLKTRLDDVGSLPERTNRPTKISRPSLSRPQRSAGRKALFVLFLMIFLFSISERISLNPSAIALFGGLVLFLLSGLDRDALISRLNLKDIVFFTGLFILVGGLEASGVLDNITTLIQLLSFGKPWLSCLVLMWTAAMVTAFLSAGPTTALFTPIVFGVGMMLPHHIIWWALSLGVLSGSSATIVGATAGPVALTLMEDFNARYRLDRNGGNTVSFRQFSRIGIPVMFMFLAVSSVYILWLCREW